MLTELARQFDLLAQGGFENWGDLLVVVVMAALWLGGALVKVLTAKRTAQQQHPQKPTSKLQPAKRETWQERLTRKAREIQQAAEAHARQMEQQARAGRQTARTPPRSAPPAGKVTIRQDRKGDSVVVYERPAGQSPAQREQHAAQQERARRAVLAAGKQTVTPPSVEPKIDIGSIGSEPLVEDLIGSMREPPSPIDMAGTKPQTPQQSVGFSPSAIIDYTDPDALRKAILHYEILGKPLALRTPSDETTSF